MVILITQSVLPRSSPALIRSVSLKPRLDLKQLRSELDLMRDTIAKRQITGASYIVHSCSLTDCSPDDFARYYDAYTEQLRIASKLRSEKNAIAAMIPKCQNAEEKYNLVEKVPIDSYHVSRLISRANTFVVPFEWRRTRRKSSTRK